MRASPQEQAGGAGVSEVCSNFQRIDWGPVPNTLHDLGTDLFVQARDDRRFDRGGIVGVQVKAGSTWFSNPVHDHAGSLVGWVYYEPNTDHFDDWVTHGLPHLLVLHDLDDRMSYWVHVTAEAVQSTGKGCKIVVPAGQTIDRNHVDALLTVAAERKPVINLEGTAWSQGVQAVPPGRRLRHALLVPRIVAPHRNAGYKSSIGPEEAVALLAQGRLRDFAAFASRHDSVLRGDKAAASRDWRWRFVAAFERLVTAEAPHDVAVLKEDAPNAAARTAACIVAACALMDEERYDEAASLLASNIDDAQEVDQAGPIDHAWLLVQLARARAQSGDSQAAREDAASARRALVGDPDDLTASAIGGAAAWLIFETTAWREQKLDELIGAIDTTVSWWRTQTLSWGLTEAVTRNFRQWADDQATRIQAEDVVNDRLYAAALNAHLVGEHNAWRTYGSMLACNTLVVEHNQGDRTSQADALDELRRSGDRESLKLAARHLWGVGPIEALVDAVRRVDPSSWNHTSAWANLTLWQHGGDVLDQAKADEVGRRCLEILSDPSDFAARTTPSFRIAPAVIDSITGIIHAASDEFHRTLAGYISRLPPITDQLEAHEVAKIVPRLRVETLTQTAVGALRGAADSQSDTRLTARLLGLLSHSDETAHSLLLDRIADGDHEALVALGNLRRLDTNHAQQLINETAGRLAGLIERANSSRSIGFGADDPADLISKLNIWFPDVAQWDIVLTFLKQDQVPAELKRDACLALAANVERLPGHVIHALKELSPQLIEATSQLSHAMIEPFSGAGKILAASVRSLDKHAIAETRAQLLTGTRHERRDAAFLIDILQQAEDTPALVALLKDPHPEVRSQAAHALAHRVANNEDEADPLATIGLRRALADRGTKVPLAVAQAFSESELPNALVVELAEPLLDHASALVREAAREVAWALP